MAGKTTRIRKGDTLPSECGYGDLFYKTSGSVGLYECVTPGNPGAWRQVYAAPTGGVTLETDGTSNGSQSLLNLAAGSDITLTDNGSGTVTIAASGSPGFGPGQGQGLTVPSSSIFTTWVNQGPATVSDGANAMLLQIPDYLTLNWAFLLKSTPGSTPYSVYGWFRSAQQQANSQATGMYIRESGSGKVIAFENLSQGGGNVSQLRVEKLNSATSDNSTAYSSVGGELCGPCFGGIFLRIRDNGTTLYFDWSLDGSAWVNVYSEAVGTFITPDQWGFGGLSVTGSAAHFVKEWVYGYKETNTAAF